MTTAIADWPPQAYKRLEIFISSTGTDDCELVKTIVTKGVLLSPAPQTINSNAYLYNVTLDAVTSLNIMSDARFTYQCGKNDKKFTLHVLNILKPGHVHTSATAEMLNAIGVYETHRIYQARTDYNGQPPKIFWQLTN